jgi:hypothetical protein
MRNDDADALRADVTAPPTCPVARSVATTE